MRLFKAWGAALFGAALLGPGLIAQSIESVALRANLLPVNVVPVAEGEKGKGWATIWIHQEKNASGTVVRSNVDFQVRYSFDGPLTPTSLRIHQADPGYNGPVVVESGFRNEAKTVDTTGRAGLARRTYWSDKDSIKALAAVMANPDKYYVTVGSDSHPEGLMRGQLLKTTVHTTVSQLSGAELVPADSRQSGTALVAMTVIAGRTSKNVLSSAEVSYEIVYSGFAPSSTIEALEWRSGAKGANGPVVLATNFTVSASGSGRMRAVEDVDVGGSRGNAITGVGTGPTAYHLALRTADKPRGAVRGQLRPTATVRLQNRLTPENQVPAVALPGASALSALDVQALRDNKGDVVAARLTFSVWYTMGAPTKLTGLSIQEGPAKQNGLLRLSSGLEDEGEESAEGSGFLRRSVLVNTKEGLAALNALARRPDLYYLNLRTAELPNGALRSQLGSTTSALPVITSASGLSKGAPVAIAGIGGQFQIRGRDLARVQGSTVSIVAGNLPATLNGTTVTVSGITANIVSVAGDTVIAVVPGNINLGRQQSMVVAVILRTVNGASNVANLTIARSGSLN
ncbi:MAG: CHRD domain-containing protein [Acidobacteria bacterium]|nr:CHRD domain-containing protein [Acidobacteriota bacterium]